ncbi:MAG: nitroreductase family protein [Oscillospiraceae bacterium]|nr:nitroreductase family protein [Oscillospiraceae bacterium]
MNLKDMIYHRKSFRSYTDEQLDVNTLRKIEDFIKNAKRLYPGEKLSWDIIGPEKIKCILPWRAPHNIAIYAERSTEALVNLGFVFQQVDLYLQSIGLGTCWLGMGKIADEAGEEFTDHSGMKCVMMIAFGKSEENLRSNAGEFKRKTLEEIADRADEKLECARLAPSAVNSQPWYFVHSGNTIHTYCMDRFFRKQFLGDMNKMDVGISLAHIYIENEDRFRYFTVENPPAEKGYLYIGSFEI